MIEERVKWNQTFTRAGRI